jgi:hypothetical protein
MIKSMRMRWAGHLVRIGKRMSVCRILLGEPKGRRPIGRPRLRWEDSIEMDLKEIE